MKKIFTSFILLSLICFNSYAIDDSKSEKIISHESPDWVTHVPQKKGYKYFVGIQTAQSPNSMRDLYSDAQNIIYSQIIVFKGLSYKFYGNELSGNIKPIDFKGLEFLKQKVVSINQVTYTRDGNKVKEPLIIIYVLARIPL